jgi:hypothetical protein
MAVRAPLYLYVGGVDYHSDADQAWQWCTGSKAQLPHRRLRAMGFDCRRVRYPLAAVPWRARWPLLMAMWAQGAVFAALAVGLFVLCVGRAVLAPHVTAARGLAVVAVIAGAGVCTALHTYYRHFLVTGLVQRELATGHASRPVWAEQVAAIRRRLDRALQKSASPQHQRPVVLLGCDAGAHLLALAVLRLLRDNNYVWPQALRAVITSDCIYDIGDYVAHTRLNADYVRSVVIAPAFGLAPDVWRSCSPLLLSDKRIALLPRELADRWFACTNFGAGDVVLRQQARAFIVRLCGSDAVHRQLLVGRPDHPAFARVINKLFS